MNFGSGASIIRFPDEGIIISPTTLRVRDFKERKFKYSKIQNHFIYLSG